MTDVRTLPLFHAVTTPSMDDAALRVARSGQIASGPAIGQFEDRLRESTGRAHWVATDNMTNALALALRLAGVGPGDEVATLAYSCMSSNSPIALCGAKAVWVDIDPDTASMSVDDLARKLTPRTKAVFLYHVAGYPAPARKIAALCRERGIALVEDCNNALGATDDGHPVGQAGDYAVLSFYPNRQINALEGGAPACPDDAAAARARRLRRFGIDATTFRASNGEINPQSDIPEVGIAATLSQLNAAVGLASSVDLAARLDAVAANAARWRAGLAGVPGIRPVTPPPGSTAVHWAFLVLADDRDALLARLKAAGVQASTLHLRNDTYSGFAAASPPLPGTDRFTAQVIGLPCGWWLAPSDIDALVAVVTTCAR
jgi:perosamine synthetase